MTGIEAERRILGPRVLDADQDVRVEHAHIARPVVDRLALVAHWSPGPAQNRSVSRLVVELQRAGYLVVLCSTSPAEGPLEFHPEEPVEPDDLTVIRRTNTGYDFGSWAVAVDHVSEHLGADKVLVVNDSLVGPFAPLDEIIADFEQTGADVWGLVENDQFVSHLQSYFRGFRHGVLEEQPLREFWRDIRVIDDKLELIAAYEFGFSALLQQHHFTTECFVHHREVVRNGLNPTAAGWRALMERGVPFVKRENFRPDNPYLSDAHLIPGAVRELYGVDVLAWL
jgi:hypothetical protein